MQRGVVGSIPRIVKNKTGRYEGDLVHYMRVLCNSATNLENPYHNLRHIGHVLWFCYAACVWYANELTKREIRNILIAAIFHDFNHTGKFGDDKVNISIALDALNEHILEVGRPWHADIARKILGTQYPHIIPDAELDLGALILRDADKTQALDPAWVQQVVLGLAREWDWKPIDVLKIQPQFLEGIRFSTEFARYRYPPKVVAEKVEEAREWFEIFDSSLAA